MAEADNRALTADDRWAIQQTLALYGHLVDGGEWAALAAIIADEAALQTPAGDFVGPAGAQAFETALAEQHGGQLPSHHTLNTVIRPGAEPGTAVAWSRYVLATYAQTAAGGDYLDTLGLRNGEWIITSRRVTERNRERPDDAYSAEGAETFASFGAAR